MTSPSKEGLPLGPGEEDEGTTTSGWGLRPKLNARPQPARNPASTDLGLVAIASSLATMGGIASAWFHAAAPLGASLMLSAASYWVLARAIARRRAADRILRTRETTMRRIADSNIVGVMFSNLDGTIEDANDAFLSMVGYSRHELREGALDWKKLTPLEWAESDRAARDAVMTYGTARPREKEYRHKDGKRIQVVVGTALLDGLKSGDCVDVVVDLTERRRLEEQVAVTNRLTALGTLVGGVAHEINNPLAAVMSNIDFAVTELGRHTNDSPPQALSAPVRTSLAEVEEVLKESLGNAERIRKIVYDLRALSHTEEGTRSPVDVESSMNSAINLVAGQIRSRCRLVLDYQGSLTVSANEPRLSQVFVGLLMNAVQAIPEGAPAANQISVSTRSTDDDRVLIEIRDTGCGIPPESVGRIFEPFFTTRGVGKGMGLGLSVCHGIVLGLGGEIQVDTKVGGGTALRVILPNQKGFVRTLVNPVVAMVAERNPGTSAAPLLGNTAGR